MPEGFWTAYWAFVSFVFGAIVGSFLNVCIWRLPRDESLSHPPSHCPACGHTLRFVPDMIPLLSQLWYRGRCRYCDERFSWRYFWVELLTALLFAGLYLRVVPWGDPLLAESARNWSAFLAMGLAAALVTVFFIDLDTYTIPDVVVLAALLFAVARDVAAIMAGRSLWQHLPGLSFAIPIPASLLQAVLAFWAMWQFAALVSALLGKEAMGGGDAVLLGAMAAFLIPWPLLVVAVMVAVVLGTVGGVAGMLLYREPQPATAAPGLLAAPAPDPGDPVGEDGGEGVGAEPREGSRSSGDSEEADLEKPEPPEIPRSGRWGRVITVGGTWLGALTLWVLARVGGDNPALGVALAAPLALAAGAVIAIGARVWLSDEEEWLKEMDAVFEDDPGPRFIPFGPYLVIGTFVAFFCGRWLIEKYAASVALTLPQWPWEF